MNEVTSDIYFDLKGKEKDKDNNANTNEITMGLCLSAKSILTTFYCSKYISK